MKKYKNLLKEQLLKIHLLFLYQHNYNTILIMYYNKFVHSFQFLIENYKFHLKWLSFGKYKIIYNSSFDVNKPGEKPEKLHGGVVGGSIL